VTVGDTFTSIRFGYHSAEQLIDLKFKVPLLHFHYLIRFPYDECAVNKV